MTDILKTYLTSDHGAYKNNTIYTGSFNITGSSSAGMNQRTFTINLTAIPDLWDILFNGPTDTTFNSDQRPSDGWFTDGYVYVLGNNAGAGYINEPTPWSFAVENINGLTLKVTASYVQTFTDVLTLTSTTVNFRVVDYSAFLNM